MSNRKRCDAGHIALGSMLAALCVVCMFLTNVVPVATYALPALAGIVVMLAVVELGRKWALMVYAAASVLSLLLVSDVEAVLMFIMFFGYYAVLKSVFESLQRPYFCIGLKFAVFNLAIISAYFLAIELFGISASEFELFGVELPLVFLIIGNAIFALFDIGMTRFITMYYLHYHPKIQKLFHISK